MYKPVLASYSGAKTLTMAKDASEGYRYGMHTAVIDLYKPKR